jgi:hypothetical protein
MSNDDNSDLLSGRILRRPKIEEPKMAHLEETVRDLKKVKFKNPNEPIPQGISINPLCTFSFCSFENHFLRFLFFFGAKIW